MASTRLETLVRAFLVTPDEEINSSTVPGDIAQRIEAKEFTLLSVIQELKESLISEDDKVRAQGLNLLSRTLSKYNTVSLDRQSTTTLVTFFVGKLTDAACWLSTLQALSELVASERFGMTEAKEIVKGVFEHVSPLSDKPQDVKFATYSLFDTLMSKPIARKALKSLGRSFIVDYCTLVTGEKDPRNLMLSFAMVKVILLEFDATEEAIDDLFDIVFCYFPITFTPPKDDPYGITSDELIVALRDCLTATALFGKLALPLFLDKLQATSERAKIQTLKALETAFPIYGAAVSGEWAARFTEAFKLEVSDSANDEIVRLSLRCTRSLYRTLVPDPAGDAMVVEPEYTPAEAPHENDHNHDHEHDHDHEHSHPHPTPAINALLMMPSVVSKLLAELLEELDEPEKSSAKAATKLISYLVTASNRLAKYVIDKVGPHLFRLFTSDERGVAARPAILESFSTILGALVAHYTSDVTAENEKVAPAPLIYPYKDELLSIFTSSLSLPTTRPSALACLVCLIQAPGLLDIAEVEFCVSRINEHLTAGSEQQHFDLVLDSLVTISKTYPRVIDAYTFPNLFNDIPYTAPARGSPEHDSYRRALLALAALCIHPELCEVLCIRLLNKLEGIFTEETPATSTQYTQSTLFAHHMLCTLYTVLTAKVEEKHTDVPKYLDLIVPRLFALHIEGTLQETQPRVSTDVRLLTDSAKIITLLVQSASRERQIKLCDALNKAFHESQLDDLLGDRLHKVLAPGPRFQPLDKSSSIEQQNLVSLFSAAIIPLKADIVIDMSELISFLTKFVDQCFNAANELQFCSIIHIIAVTINKQAKELSEFVKTTIMDQAWNTYITPELTPKTQRALLLSTWVCKSLVVRSEPLGYELLDKLLMLLEDNPSSELAILAAESLGVIADESDNVLSKKNGAVTRLLYKQRVFSQILPRILKGYEVANEEIRASSSERAQQQRAIYLVALSCILQHLPKTMSLNELPKLLPLLITALSLIDNKALKANIVDGLAVLAKESPNELEEFVVEIVEKLLPYLKDVGDRSASSFKLQSSIITLLGILPDTVPRSRLQSKVRMIIKALGVAVDSPKREIRNIAVDCRMRWYIYG